MGDQHVRRSKRLLMENGAPPSKRMKLNNEMVMEDGGLNFDCLDLIFEYLDIMSLLNVAIARQVLQAPALSVYRRKFASKIIYMHVSSKGNGTRVYEKKNYIRIRGTRACLSFLRYFGSSISDLRIYYEESKLKNIKFIDKWINQYCGDSLTDISYYNMPKSPEKHYQKPFINVERVFLQDFGDKHILQDKYFPNLRELSLNDYNFYHPLMEEPLQRLEHLNIRVSDSSSRKYIQNITDFINMHSHLRHLSIALKNGSLKYIVEIGDIIKNTSITDLSIFKRDFMDYLPEFISWLLSLVKPISIKFWIHTNKEMVLERINRLIDVHNSSGRFGIEISTWEKIMSQNTFFGKVISCDYYCKSFNYGYNYNIYVPPSRALESIRLDLNHLS